MAEFFNIGKFVAIHGLRGDLLLQHSLGKKTSLKGLKALFIEEKKNSFLPWFVESTKIKSAEEVYIKLEGINSREAAAKLAQKQVWLPEKDFKKLAAKTAPASLLGYTIVEKDQRKHAIQFFQPSFSFLNKQLQHNFGIGIGPESNAIVL